MRSVTKDELSAFGRYLCENEKSDITVEKYLRDVGKFMAFTGEGEIEKGEVLAYKEMLGREYALTSANSMIAALNAFFRYLGRQDLCVKQFKMQKKAFCSADKELSEAEYRRLVRAAEKRENERLSLVLQTICSTGIRVSELAYITVEAVTMGKATVTCKGKTRCVFIVSSLQRKLMRYAKKQGIVSGKIFTTKNGRAMNRSNIWKEMKALCHMAGVSPSKVFPHNLRHLFARIFYGLEKDIAKLADILGHASINTTRIYIVTTGEEHRRRMERMHLIL